MNYEEAEAIIIEDIEKKDMDYFKGFSHLEDMFWSGSYNTEVNLKNDNSIAFDGVISWDYNEDKGIDNVEIQSINFFELLDESGETIQNFLTN